MRNVNSVERRFWAKVDTSGDCWLWTGCTAPNGYGRMSFEGGQEYAHRVSWVLHSGAIPYKQVVDHKCRVRNCVNPRHLQILTRQENSSIGNKGRRHKVCKRGHDQTDPKNVFQHTRLSGPRKGEVWFGCAKCNRERARSQ